MAKYGLKVKSGGIELLDTNRMGCVFRLYGDSHNVPHGQFSQVDFPLPAASVASIFGDYTTAAVVSAFNDGYDFDKNFDGINFYSSPEKNERYLNLIRSARVTQQLTSDGKHISSSSHPLVGCSNNINGASNYEAIAAGLPKSAYGLFGKDNLLHLATSVNAYKLVAVEGYITSQINTYRQVFDPNTIEFSDVGKTKEAARAAMRRAMEMERAASVISIPCSPNEVLAVQCRTPGVIVALYHKSTSHEIYVCVGAHSAELRVYRYTNNPDEKRIPVHFNSKYGIKIKGTVSKFDSRQPLMIPIWVSYSGPPLNFMVSPYKTAVVFSNIRNLVIDRISDQQSINVPAGTVVLPAVMWLDEYRVNYNFVCMIGWESNVHSFYANYGSSFVGMFTDAAYPQRMLSDAPALFAERDETRVMDPTMARNKRLYYSNWNNINDMGGYMGVIAYDV